MAPSPFMRGWLTLLAAFAFVFAAACGDNYKGTPTETELSVTPGAASLAIGETVQLAATFADETGDRDVTAEAAWSSSDNAVATVSAGLVTGVASGEITITATFEGSTATATVTVEGAELVAIDVTPTEPSLALGTEQQLSATGRYADSTTRDLTSEVTWTSENASVTVSATGLVEAVTEGTSEVTATLGDISGSTTVTATAAALVSLQVTPTNPTVGAGTSQQFTATGTFSDATTQDLTAEVTWTSSMTSVATIDPAGLATALTAGTTTIRAAVGSILAETTLTVTGSTLVAIDITPAMPSVALGGEQQLVATGRFSDNSTQDITAMVTWASMDPAIASVSDDAATKGLVTTQGVGSTTITATMSGVTGQTTFTVTDAQLQTIEISPANPTVPEGAAQQFTATGMFSDNTTRDITTQVTWTSSDQNVATISNAAGTEGVATTLTPGTTTITATSVNITATTVLTVSDAALVSIRIEPASSTLPRGRTRQLAAIARYSDSTERDITTEVTWSSSDNNIATVSNAAGSEGLATAVNVGTATLTATSGMISGTATLEVTAAELVAIVIAPDNVTIPDGVTQQYTAQGRYSDSTTQDLTEQVTWTSSDAAVATISNAATERGLATAVAPGTTTITATLGMISDTTTLVVSEAALVSIAIAPQNPSIPEGETQPLVATGTYTDGSTRNVTAEVTWTSSDAAIATVSNAVGTEGVVTGVAPGMATITATLGMISATTNVTVTRVPPTVTATNPADGATNVVATTPISVTFSRPMTTASLTVQSAAGACSGSLQVSADNFVSCIGLAMPTFSAGDTTVTTSATPGLAFGRTYRIRVTTDVTSASGTPMAATYTHAMGFTTEVDPPCADHVVISQIFGANSATNAFNRDFVELHNPTAAPIDISGYSIQYASATGMSWNPTNPIPVGTSIPAGGYYLVGLATSTGGNDIPMPDFTDTGTNMSGTSGKVALTLSPVALVGSCPTGGTIVDFVGYGTADCSEGSPAPAGSGATGARRKRDGSRDTDQNARDFESVAPTPRNSTSTPVPCTRSANETGLAGELDFCNLQHPPMTSTQVGMMSELVYTRVFEAMVTEAPGASPTIRAQIGFGPANTNPQLAAGWTWADATFNTQIGNDDEYSRSLVAPAAPGTYAYTSRITRDGTSWTYCDLDGAGSNPDLAFDPARLGVWTVTAP